MNTFSYRGKSVDVYIENELDGHRIEWTEFGVKRQYIVRDVNQNFQKKQIHVSYILQNKDGADNVVGPIQPFNYKIVNDAEWDYFYTLSNTDSLGVTIGKNLVNGMINEVFGKDEDTQGVRCFKEDGSFYQPIICDVVAVESTETGGNGSITVTLVDGDTPETYALLDSEDVELVSASGTNTFTDLAPGTYKVVVANANTSRTIVVVIEDTI